MMMRNIPKYLGEKLKKVEIPFSIKNWDNATSG